MKSRNLLPAATLLAALATSPFHVRADDDDDFIAAHRQGCTLQDIIAAIAAHQGVHVENQVWLAHFAASLSSLRAA